MEYIVGAPQNMVTLCFCMAVSVVAGSNLGSIIIFPPRYMGAFIPVVMP